MGSSATLAEVKVTESAEAIRFEVDGKLFTEWRTKDWVAPFLYPVVGPNGESVTRHYPMKAGLPGEEQDHPWHRSIRFSHSDVNGFNFCGLPAKSSPAIRPRSSWRRSSGSRLERPAKRFFGTSGSATASDCCANESASRLRRSPRSETLLDYDIELHASDGPVKFGDKRDGGLLVRVAGTMKAEDEKGTSSPARS